MTYQHYQAEMELAERVEQGLVPGIPGFARPLAARRIRERAWQAFVRAAEPESELDAILRAEGLRAQGGAQ